MLFSPFKMPRSSDYWNRFLGQRAFGYPNRPRWATPAFWDPVRVGLQRSRHNTRAGWRHYTHFNPQVTRNPYTAANKIGSWYKNRKAFRASRPMRMYPSVYPTRNPIYYGKNKRHYKKERYGFKQDANKGAWRLRKLSKEEIEIKALDLIRRQRVRQSKIPHAEFGVNGTTDVDMEGIEAPIFNIGDQRLFYEGNVNPEDLDPSEPIQEQIQEMANVADVPLTIGVDSSSAIIPKENVFKARPKRKRNPDGEPFALIEWDEEGGYPKYQKYAGNGVAIMDEI